MAGTVAANGVVVVAAFPGRGGAAEVAARVTRNTSGSRTM